MNLFYTEKAREDLQLAYQWYESQLNGLGDQFLEQIERVLEKLLIFPEHCPVAREPYRRCLIQKFPYSLFYIIELEDIVIQSIFHNHRKPEFLDSK